MLSFWSLRCPSLFTAWRSLLPNSLAPTACWHEIKAHNYHTKEPSSTGPQPGGPACRRQGGGAPGGPVAHPAGDRGGLSPPPPAGERLSPPLYKASPLIPSSFDLKKSTKKSRKKIGVRIREAAKLCRIPHL